MSSASSSMFLDRPTFSASLISASTASTSLLSKAFSKRDPASICFTLLQARLISSGGTDAVVAFSIHARMSSTLSPLMTSVKASCARRNTRRRCASSITARSTFMVLASSIAFSSTSTEVLISAVSRLSQPRIFSSFVVPAARMSSVTPRCVAAATASSSSWMSGSSWLSNRCKSSIHLNCSRRRVARSTKTWVISRSRATVRASLSPWISAPRLASSKFRTLSREAYKVLAWSTSCCLTFSISASSAAILRVSMIPSFGSRS
mmetsp:Transcript_17434/g.38399  ORF Transcript_17434/g.38399 Transcript_17434/m.38399 type:complete len:263 (-) Transcript_17434:16-804(-)